MIQHEIQFNNIFLLKIESVLFMSVKGASVRVIVGSLFPPAKRFIYDLYKTVYIGAGSGHSSSKKKKK